MKKKYIPLDEYDEEVSQEPVSTTEEFGCGFCWDSKRNTNKELFFLDAANNMRPCTYCPSCGRKFNE